jgi:hypothetical protein
VTNQISTLEYFKSALQILMLCRLCIDTFAQDCFRPSGARNLLILVVSIEIFLLGLRHIAEIDPPVGFNLEDMGSFLRGEGSGNTMAWVRLVDSGT